MRRKFPFAVGEIVSGVEILEIHRGLVCYDDIIKGKCLNCGSIKTWKYRGFWVRTKKPTIYCDDCRPCGKSRVRHVKRRQVKKQIKPGYKFFDLPRPSSQISTKSWR